MPRTGGHHMKRLISTCVLSLACTALGTAGIGVVWSQDRSLFKQTDTSANKRTDSEAIQAWWRDIHGDGGPSLKILEAKPATDPNRFDVKIDGDWVNCGKLAKLRTENARAVIAKIQASGGGKTKTENRLFIIGDGEVIISKDVWKKL